jgi:DNA polymerase-3 subunit alpha
MNSDAGNIDRITIEVEECTRMGMKVLPPDVNESFAGFAVVKGTTNIRWGLMAIKNVGTEIAELIVKERKKGGPFVDLPDFLARIRSHAFNKKTLEALLKTGAFDKFGDRITLVSNLDSLVMYNKQVNEERERNQSSLFELTPEMNSKKLILRPADPLPKSAMLSWEKELLGLYVSSHPAGLFFDQFSRFVSPTKSVNELADKTMIKICGVISAVKQIYTKAKNEPMAFVRIEDPSGGVECVVFPKTYVTVREKLNPDTFVVVTGKVSVRKREDSDIEEHSVLVDGVLSFTEAEIPEIAGMLSQGGFDAERTAPKKIEVSPTTNSQLPTTFTIKVPDRPSNEMIMKLRDIFRSSPGTVRVHLEVMSAGEPKKIATEYCVAATREVARKVGEIVGEENVRY